VGVASPLVGRPPKKEKKKYEEKYLEVDYSDCDYDSDGDKLNRSGTELHAMKSWDASLRQKSKKIWLIILMLSIEINK